MSFLLFAALAGVVQFSGYYNFRNRVQKNESANAIVVVDREDAALKKKGINLPGYNAPDDVESGYALQSISIGKASGFQLVDDSSGRSLPK